MVGFISRGRDFRPEQRHPADVRVGTPFRGCRGISAVALLCVSLVIPPFFGALAGCDSKMAQGITCPEVRVKWRGALLDNSLVLIVTNAGAKPLFDVCVSSQRWSKKYTVAATLRPGDSAEAGWIELPSGLRSGDTVEIFAEGFRDPYREKIP